MGIRLACPPTRVVYHKMVLRRVYPPRDAIHQPAVTMAASRDSRCIHVPGACWSTPVQGRGAMKRIFRKMRDRLRKDPPPPYRENESPHPVERFRDVYELEQPQPLEVLDLLANCRLTPREDTGDSEVEYAEIEDMGLWHSTPLSHRHKSKISLTWVLKENLDRPIKHDRVKNTIDEIDRYQQQNQKFNDKRKKCAKENKERVVGRNEYYHNMRIQSACNLVASCSDDSGGEEWRRRHKHRHRRKKRRQSGRFGYDIRDLDCFLSEASIDRPGNIPVVVAYPTSLYRTHNGHQTELTLPLGTVVNAVFKNQQWLYAQTPHGDEGYVLYSACLPLGILPNRTPQKKTPCWESSTDIYPRPCGNLTDNEKELIRGRTRSECRYRPKTTDKRRSQTKSCAEEQFDTLYLKTKSVCSNIDKYYENCDPKRSLSNVKKKPSVRLSEVKRQQLLLVNSDFRGSAVNGTLSVQKDEVVVLVEGKGETDVDAEWFYVRKRDGSQGFIPAVVAGHGFI